VKEAVIAQLVNDSSDASRSLVKKALHDQAVEVRKSVINNIVSIPSAMRTDFETLLTDSSYDVVTAALTKLSEQFRIGYRNTLTSPREWMEWTVR